MNDLGFQVTTDNTTGLKYYSKDTVDAYFTNFRESVDHQMDRLKDENKYQKELNSKYQDEITKLRNKIIRLEAQIKEHNKNLKPREPKYPASVQREIVRKWYAGRTKKSLAEEYRVSRSTVLNYVKKWGDNSVEDDMEELNNSDSRSNEVNESQKYNSNTVKKENDTKTVSTYNPVGPNHKISYSDMFRNL